MWLVVGGQGQLGRCLHDALTASGVSHVNVGKDEVDITSPDSVNSCIHRFAPTVIVNAAAWTAVDDAEDNETAAYSVNCNGAHNVALAAAKADARLVHISTDYVFPGTATEPISENEAGEPLGAYGRTKWAGEKAVRDACPDSSLIVRTAWLYSQFGANFARTMTRRALAQQPVRVVNDQFGQPTSAVDLSYHIIDLVNRQVPTGIYHGTNAGKTSWYDFARKIYELCQVDTELVTAVPASEYPTKAMRPAYSVLSHNATTRLGVSEMRNWDDAIAHLMPEIIRTINDK